MLRTLPEHIDHAVDAVVIGASAGGVEALLALLGGLPADFQLPIVVVLHLPGDRESLLAEVFGPRVTLAAREARAGEAIAPATLYFAPAGYHLLVEPDHSFSLSCDAPLHFSRPSIDVLFESAADAWGARLAGVILTGANEDGAAGLACIKRAGGLTIVQDPAQSRSSAMPQAAIARRMPDFLLSLDDIRTLLVNLDRALCLPTPSPNS